MVYVKKSQLPKAGKGLFADKEYRRGDIVCEYAGEVVTWAECEKRAEKGYGGYVFFISKHHCVDAYFTKWALGRFANDARGVGRVSGLRNNAQYQVKRRNGERKVYIVASMTIHPGDEIFVHYGDDYWRYLEGTRDIYLARERERMRKYREKKKLESKLKDKKTKKRA